MSKLQQFSATLPDGREVIMKEMDTDTEAMAYVSAGSPNSANMMEWRRFIREAVKMTLVSIGGKMVIYDQLGNLSSFFSPKDLRLVEDLFDRINYPSREERLAFFATIGPRMEIKQTEENSGEGGRAHSGRMSRS